MKRSDTRENYGYFSEKLSDITRQLDFAGIAVVWILRVGTDSGGIAFDKKLLVPLLAFVLSLGCDLLHYAYATAAWGIFNRMKERQELNDDAIFHAPSVINWASLAFFWIKVLLVAIGMILLLNYLWMKI